MKYHPLNSVFISFRIQMRSGCFSTRLLVYCLFWDTRIREHSGQISVQIKIISLTQFAALKIFLKCTLHWNTNSHDLLLKYELQIYPGYISQYSISMTLRTELRLAGKTEQNSKAVCCEVKWISPNLTIHSLHAPEFSWQNGYKTRMHSRRHHSD